MPMRRCRSAFGRRTARSIFRCLAALPLIAILLTAAGEAALSAHAAVPETLALAAGDTLDVGPPPVPQPVPAPPKAGPLSHFYLALRGLQDHSRQAPVTILHLGDSHIASDSLTREIRRLLQHRFGEAGRGMMQPFGAVPYQQADGIAFSVKGSWSFANSLKVHSGPFGVAGARATSSSADAVMSLTAQERPFDWASVTVLTGPGQGKLKIVVDEQETTVDLAATRQESQTVRLGVRGSRLTVRPVGGDPVTILGWSVGSASPGVRYVSLGIPGARASTTSAWDPALVAADVRSIAPDLIVLGYGTNEAFDDGLAAADYRRTVVRLIGWLKAAAPRASLVIITPPDVARQSRGALAGANPCGFRLDGTPYGSDRIRLQWQRLRTRWEAPRSLWLVRQTLEDVARRSGAFVWDWSQAMGGPCSIDEWVQARPGLAGPDHVHQTQRGYDRSSRSFYDALMADYPKASGLATSAEAP